MMSVQKMGLKPKMISESANRERYRAHFTRFVESEYTYNTHMLVKRICESGQKEPYMYGVPLYKIMVEVVKIMMMNELETLFLGSTLQEMKWKITDPCLDDYVNEAEDVTPLLQKDSMTKKVQFSLLLISYIVKIYLNEDSTLIDFKIRDIIKQNFDRMYQTWVGRVSTNFKFNPKSMNRIFKDFDTRKQQKKVQIVDYNKLVAQFFTQNEPTYPEQHNNEPSKYEEERERPQYKSPVEAYHDNMYSRSNSRYNTRRNDIDELPLQEEEEELPQIHQRRSSNRLTHKISEIGFMRRESGNQFFAPETNRKGIFGLDILRNSSSRADDSPHR